MTTKNATLRSFTTSVDIPADSRTKINRVLNQHLANSFDLMSQVKQAHWNVKGSDFWQLHKLFDEVAERAAEWVDEFAERVTALGGYATGTVRMAAASSTLPEFPTEITDSMDYRPGRRGTSCRLHQLRPRSDRPDRRAGRCRHGGPLHRGQSLRRQVPLLPRGAPPGLADPSPHRDPSRSIPMPLPRTVLTALSVERSSPPRTDVGAFGRLARSKMNELPLAVCFPRDDGEFSRVS